MKKAYSLVAAITVCTAIATYQMPLWAQTPSSTTIRADNSNLNRAKNLARVAAEKVNGGVEKYRAEASMHGPAQQSPYVDHGNGSWTFTFVGSKPGDVAPSIESVVTVALDGKKVMVDYNGPIRQR